MIDAQMPRVNIIGTDNAINAREVVSLYYQRYRHVPMLMMGTREAEAIKLMTNSFFATKVAFFNEMNAYAEKEGLRWEDIITGMLADGRICPEHTKVPGPDGKYGFGGECLPKDTECLLNLIASAECKIDMLRSAIIRNERDRQREVE